MNETLYNDIDNTLIFDLNEELYELYHNFNVLDSKIMDIFPYSASDILCYVDVNNTNLFKDGLSWNTAFNDLQQCLDLLAINGGEIWVKKGVYIPTTVPQWKINVGKTSNIHKSFSLYDNIRIYGGFDGSETNRDQRNFKLNPTYLSCKLTETKYCNEILIAADNTLIDGFVFQHAGLGNINDNSRRRLANSLTVDKILTATSANSKLTNLLFFSFLFFFWINYILINITGGSGIFSNSTNITIINTIFLKLFSSGKGKYTLYQSILITIFL